MDGKGLQEFTKTMGKLFQSDFLSLYEIGSGSNAGCNVCNFPGKSFAGACTYQNHRRYLPLDDYRRSLCKDTANSNFLQYPCTDYDTFPTMKIYDDYWRIGYQAEITGRPDKKRGIKGLWKLHDLPYMRDIFWAKDGMHCFANIIKDSINVLRPTHKGFVNRTEKDTVRNNCQKLGIFKELHIPQTEGGEIQPARWTLTPTQINSIHDKMKNLPMGLRKPFQTGGGEYSHDKLLFATIYASNVLSVEEGIGCPHVTENILKLFSIITHLTSNEFEIQEHNNLMKYIYDALADHDGLLPPSEATYTLHELVHVANQILDCGPPLMVSMFKYERQNKYLKKLLKNQRYPISSIVRNYLISELSTLLIGTSIENTERLSEVFEYVDKGISSKVTAGLIGLSKLRFESPDKIICEELNITEEETISTIPPLSQTLLAFLLDSSN